MCSKALLCVGGNLDSEIFMASKIRKASREVTGTGHGPWQSSLWSSERAGRKMLPQAGLSVELFTAWTFFLRSDFVLRGPRQSRVSGLGTRLQAHEFDLPSHPLRT